MRTRAQSADAPDSDDERFVVSDGHESSDSGEESKDDEDNDEEENETKPKQTDHAVAAGTSAAAAAQPPTTTLWSFTLRQSFGVYLQMLVSACIDADFLNSLQSDSASETSQYFMNAAFHVERQLLSRRDGIASSNVWEKSFQVWENTLLFLSLPTLFTRSLMHTGHTAVETVFPFAPTEGTGGALRGMQEKPHRVVCGYAVWGALRLRGAVGRNAFTARVPCHRASQEPRERGGRQR